MKRNLFLLNVLAIVMAFPVKGQEAAEIIKKVKTKLDKVSDYEASGTMKMNVNFIKAPVARVKIFYKKPDQLKIENINGISLVPKGTINISLGHIITHSGDYDIIDAGTEKNGWRVIKLLPRDENSDVVLSTLYIDTSRLLINKARTTTKTSGTYELEFTYGKYAGYGLADKVVFSFNIREYKLPKGVTFDYDDGKSKEREKSRSKDDQGKIEITYASYTINKGVPDSVFK